MLDYLIHERGKERKKPKKKGEMRGSLALGDLISTPRTGEQEKKVGGSVSLRERGGLNRAENREKKQT